MSFSSDQELSNAITQRLISATGYVVEKILDKNEDTIAKVVYSAYSPTTYERTNEFKEAWDTMTSGGGKHAEGEFFYQPNSMSSTPGDNGHLAQHASQVSGASMIDVMPDILYEGSMGCIFRPTHRDAWDELDKWITVQRMKKWFGAGLRHSGLPWTGEEGSADKFYE